MDLIDEVRFIDDANAEDHRFIAPLEALHPKVRVITNKERIGLTRSKVVGTIGVKSPVIIFLEPHCVFGESWLEPLLHRLAVSSKSTVVMPVIDLINEPYAENMPKSQMYGKASLNAGGFDLETLTFTWLPLQDRNRTYREPDIFATPAMPGGIFAMWRSFWEESGRYDEGMGEWGGENIEMSIRLWTCGGRIEAVPCSRLFHWFRKRRPYVFHGQVGQINSKRTAVVWLDEFIDRFYEGSPSMRSLDAGDVSERLALRKKLQCKPFAWYTETIYPELAKPRGRAQRLSH